MGQTLAEKILSLRTGREVRAGDIIITGVDLAFAQDTTGPLTVRQFNTAGFEHLADPQKTALFLDHAAPSPNQELANDHIFLRQFAGLFYKADHSGGELLLNTVGEVNHGGVPCHKSSIT